MNARISSVTIVLVIRPIAVNSKIVPMVVAMSFNVHWVWHSTKTRINAIGPILCQTVMLKLS